MIEIEQEVILLFKKTLKTRHRKIYIKILNK